MTKKVQSCIGVLEGGPRGPWSPLAKIFSLAEQKWVAWQKRNWQFGRKELESLKVQKQNMASIPLFLHILSSFLPSLYVFSHFCLVSAIYLPIFLQFCLFLSHHSAIFEQIKIGRTEWHKRMIHQLGRTELENLGPPERIFFWQNRIEFWQKEIVGPPLKNAPRTPMPVPYLM